jgi:hypothetical protein
MDTEKTGDHPHLFLLRLSFEAASGGQPEGWRGRVQHVISGEVRQFHDRDSMLQSLVALLGPGRSSEEDTMSLGEG